MSTAPPALCLRDRVIGALVAAHVPIADVGIARSGIAVSPNGRVLRVATYASDGGMGRPSEVWDAYLALARALLREAGLPVIVSKPGLEMLVGSVAASQPPSSQPNAPR